MATRWQCSPLDDDVLQAPPWIQSSLYITGAAPAGEHLNRVGTHHHLGGACPSASATQHALPLHVFVPPNAKQMAPGASAWRQADLTPRPGRTGQALLRVHLQRLRSRDASDSVHTGRLYYQALSRLGQGLCSLSRGDGLGPLPRPACCPQLCPSHVPPPGRRGGGEGGTVAP